MSAETHTEMLGTAIANVLNSLAALFEARAIRSGALFGERAQALRECATECRQSAEHMRGQGHE